VDVDRFPAALAFVQQAAMPVSLLRFSLQRKPHSNEEGHADGQKNPDQASKLADLSARLSSVLLLVGSYFTETPQC
jgi:hypothetical protein